VGLDHLLVAGQLFSFSTLMLLDQQHQSTEGKYLASHQKCWLGPVFCKTVCLPITYIVLVETLTLFYPILSYHVGINNPVAYLFAKHLTLCLVRSGEVLWSCGVTCWFTEMQFGTALVPNNSVAVTSPASQPIGGGAQLVQVQPRNGPTRLQTNTDQRHT